MEGINKQKIQWIDTAKLLGIYLVILGHIKLSNQYATNIIYSFHVPLFFFLSGLTFHDKSMKLVLKKSFKRLIIPYLSMYLITYPWWFFVSFLRHPELYDRTIHHGLIKPLLGMFLGIGLDTDYSYMTNVPLWFLLGLFWCRMIAVISKKTNEKHPIMTQIIFSAIVTATVVLFWRTDIIIPFSLGAAFMAYPFFALGIILSPKIKHSINEKSKKSKAFVILSGIVLMLFILLVSARLNGRADINHLLYGKSLVLFYLAAVAGISATILISILLSKKLKSFNILSQNTLVILGFHGIFTGCIEYVIRFIHHTEKEFIPSPVEGAGIAFVSLLLCGIPAIILSRRFPRIIGQSPSRA